jgi:GAF domain-containing protein
MSTTRDSTLANPEQLIADLERQLAECRAERDEAQQQLTERTIERDEAHAQQTATAEVLQVINSSPGDLTPVFNAILEKAHSLCGADFGALKTYDGEFFRHAAARSPSASARYGELMGADFRPGVGSVWARLLSGERFVHDFDLAEVAARASQDRAPHLEALVEIGIRTQLIVPLCKDDRLLGAISANRREVRPFSDTQIALLENFAAQAVIAMENARLITETREALEQQTATAEVLQVINSSPGDLAPVFEAVVEKATRLCEATHGYLFTYDGERFHPGAEIGDSRYVEWTRQHGPFQPPANTALGRIRRGERLVHVADIRKDDSFDTVSAIRQVAEVSGARSVLTVALRRDEVLLGGLGVYRQEVRPFSDKQIALLENFAAQAVIAIENARLLTETREALEQQTATAEVLQVINSSPGDLTPVFDAILEKAHSLCGVAFGSLMLYDGETFRAAAVHAMSEAFAERLRKGSLGIDAPPFIGPLLDGARFVHVRDMAEIDHPSARAAVELTGVHTSLFVPLRKDGVLLGVISAVRPETRPFSDKEIALVENFAAQAVIAMENARLITETREALEQQTATAEVLGVINSSPGDLAPVFDAILEKAHTLCGAARGSLVTYDGEFFRAIATRGLPEAFDEVMRRGFPFIPGGPVEPLARGEHVHIIDFPAFAREGPPEIAELVRPSLELAGTRTLLMVPLCKDGGLLGYIAGYRTQVQPFTDKQIALLQNFAAQAVIAMENARLITETHEALEQQTATAEVLQVINSSPGDLAPVFDAMLEKTLRLCEAAHGNFLTYDGEVFHQAAFRGEPQFAEYRRQQGPLRPAEFGQLARVVQGGGTLHRIDAREGEAYRDDPAFRRMVDGLGIRTSLTVPLRKGDALLGLVRAYRLEVRAFTDKQIALLQNFAAQAVIAMENARLLGELRQRTEEVGELNRDLEARVAAQVDELGRVGRLKRFLAPQLAELIVSHGDENILESHRREIVVVFCDLRGYTAFTETAEPEEVLDFLREYHGALGPLVSQYEGTLDQFSGDGIMVFFNDPVPCPDPAERAVKMAMAMREAAAKLIAAWRRHGSELGFGAGIAQGYATLGQIGFSDRSGYTAIGTVCNLAARLCAEAKDGQILVSSRIAEAVEAVARLEDLGNLELKGLRRPVAAFNVVQSTSSAEARPNLTVVAKGPGV